MTVLISKQLVPTLRKNNASVQLLEVKNRPVHSTKLYFDILMELS